jgi:replicative DNA helicase
MSVNGQNKRTNLSEFRKREVVNITTDFGMMPPQAIDLEEAIIGAAMLEPSALNVVIEIVTPEDFYKETHKLIFEALLKMFQQNKPIDLLTVTQFLLTTGTLNEAGGAFYITNLTSRVASAANIEYHARIVKQMSIKRTLIKTCSLIVRDSYQDTTDVFEVVEIAQKELDDAMNGIVNNKVANVTDIFNANMQEARNAALHGIRTGISSGLMLLDNLTNGSQPGELIIIAGRPGMGKSSLALSMAAYSAILDNVPTAFFSLEMPSSQIVGRMSAFYSGIGASRITKKQLSIQEIEQIEETGKIIKNKPFHIDDTPSLTLTELKAKARNLVREHGVKIIYVDYLQLMRSGQNLFNREQEVAEISRGLKSLAKELKIPIIALSQLSRSVESRGGDKKPMLQDLRESGSIEMDADMVMFCYRPEYYGIEGYEVGMETIDTSGLFMLLIAKHRNGELGEIPLKMVHSATQVINHEHWAPKTTTKTNSFDEIVNNSSGITISPNTGFYSEKNIKPDDEAPF